MTVVAVLPQALMDADELASSLAEREGDARELAGAAVARLGEGAVRSLAVELLTDAVRRERRAHARVIEERAAIESRDAEQRARRDEQAIRDNEMAARTRVLHERAELIQRDFDAGELTLEQAAEAIGQVNSQLPWSEPMRWVVMAVKGSYEGIEVERELRVSGPESLRAHPHVVSIAQDAAKREYERRQSRVAAGFAPDGTWADDLRVILERYAAEVRLEVTAELLGSKFAANGREVTWGEATVADHQARIDAQIAHAAGTMADVSRHQAAIDLLTKVGARCLDEVDHG